MITQLLSIDLFDFFKQFFQFLFNHKIWHLFLFFSIFSDLKNHFTSILKLKFIEFNKQYV